MTHKIFGQYEYDKADVIGFGGMGTVYRGVDLETPGQSVAIKYLKPEVVQQNPQMLERFRLEGEALRDLNHPNIVKMLDAGPDGNDHFLVMEYVPGGSLRELMDREATLSLQRVLYIALDLADALTRAHRLHILHRDIKPGNVLLADDGTPRLTDFGVARTRASKVTQDGQLVGTLAYISPEALTGGTVDERHDIWAFGVMLFEMLAGHRPFQSETVGKLIQQITTQPLPDLESLRPDAPVALVDLVYRMMDRNLSTRIRSVRQVGAELERIIHSDGSDSPVGLLPTDAAARFRTTTSANVVQTDTSTTPTDVYKAPQLVNMPVTGTPFVGRSQELSEIVGLLSKDGVRLVTLVGPGGIGKTRVAAAVAEELVSAFPDGVYFVPLESVERMEMAPIKIAEVLGFQFSGGDDQVEEMMAYMREKTALIVLDNLEHIVDGAEMITSKMEMAPHIKILATSRERLRLRGEHVYELNAMIVPPDGMTDPEALASFPSAQLFVSSAARVAPNFKLDEETAPYVARIISLVHGMPIGIELAAGWLEMLPADEIAQEIEQSMDFLESNLRDVPERHRSIRAVFDYSWDLMTEAERDAFMKLSVFRDGFERAAAQKVTGTSLRVLTALVNKSLLKRKPDGRYDVAKLSRQYGEAQAEANPDVMEPVYEAYVDNYTLFIEKLNEEFGSARDLQAMKAAEVEIENLRHALDIAIERVMVDNLNRLALPMYQYYFARSLLMESINTFRDISDVLEVTGQADTPAYCRAQVLLSSVLGRIGNYRESEQMAERILPVVKEQDSQLYAALAYNALCYAAMMQGNYDEAREYAREAVKYGEEMNKTNEKGVVLAMGNGLGNLGYLEFLAGNLQEARQIYEKLNKYYYTPEQSPIGYAFGQNNLGEILQALGEHQSAMQHFQNAYEVFKANSHKRGMAFTSNNMGGVHVMMQEYEKAAEFYNKSYELNKQIGDRAGLGHSLSAMAQIAMFEENLDDALGYYQQAAVLRQEIGDRVGYARSLMEVAMVEWMRGNIDAARPNVEEAAILAETLGNEVVRSYVDLGHGIIASADGKAEVAFGYFQKVVSKVRDESISEAYFLAMTALLLAAQLYEQQREDAKAAQILGFVDSTDETGDIGVMPVVSHVMTDLRRVLKRRMGGAYKAAYATGESMTLDDLLPITVSRG